MSFKILNTPSTSDAVYICIVLYSILSIKQCGSTEAKNARPLMEEAGDRAVQW